MSKQNMQFQTEIKQLLDIMIHSLYSHKEIFLRELISNSSDAIDKARFESLQNGAILEGDSQWKIRVVLDKDMKTITISDNGIGMTREEMVQNLGTIAKSGTKEFLQTVKQAKDASTMELIGKFGVGFYSAFMISQSVTVISRKAGTSESSLWQSTGDGNFSVEEALREKRGTDVILKLKEDEEEFLEDFKIREIIKKYSDYIEHPIELEFKKVDPKKRDAKKTETTIVNSQKAIWLRSKSEIKPEEYNEFYKHVSHDWNEPAKTIHYSAEGTSEFKALLYLPSKAPFDLFMPQHKGSAIHLYVNRVFITDDCKELTPEYLRFLRGVVDSSDLPLNISREMLQHNRNLALIRKNIVTKVLGTLAEMKEKESAAYESFYKAFGAVLKEGIHADFENRDKIKDLLLFESLNVEAGKTISLKQYVSEMPSGQTDIYFITAESRSEAATSPHLEAFRRKGYNVLFMTDQIDEWVSLDLHQYDNHPFKSIIKGDVELGNDEDKKAQKEKKKKFQKLVQVIAEKLSDRVKEVRLSNRLTDSACCLVADEDAMNARMERMMSAFNPETPKTKRILEINPSHPLIEKMNGLAEKDTKHPKLEEYARMLYDQSLLTEGSKLEDPAAFARKVSEMMAGQLEG